MPAWHSYSKKYLPPALPFSYEGEMNLNSPLFDRIRTRRKAEQASARERAFSLLDALSQSGTLPLTHSALHVIMGCVHSFDDTLMNVVVRGNVNPIAALEESTLAIVQTLHAL